MKGLLIQSVAKMTSKLDLLVEAFYMYFLQNEPSKQLFRNVDNIKKYNMFNAALSAIITNIKNHEQIQTNFKNIINRHKLMELIQVMLNILLML